MKFKNAEECKAAIKALENIGLKADQDWYDQLKALGGDLEIEIPVTVKVAATTRKSRTMTTKPSRATFSNAFPFAPQELLSDEENDFLNKINTFMGYQFRNVSCIGELQQKVELVLKNEEKTKEAETFVTIRELQVQLRKIEDKLKELDRNKEERCKAYRDFYRSIDWQNSTDRDREKANKLERAIQNPKEYDITQILMIRKKKIKKILSDHPYSNPDEQVSLSSSYSVFGEYIRPQNPNETPQIILYLKGIRNKYYWNEKQKYAIAQTYIHEMFHAYYDADPYGPDYYIKKVEEPLTELGALTFIDDFVEVTKDKAFKQHALDSVEVKRYNAAISFYGFGYYLFNTAGCDKLIGKWYDIRSKINDSFPAVQDYEEMFRVGYPDDEKECERRLKAVLGISSTKSSTSRTTKKTTAVTDGRSVGYPDVIVEYHPIYQSFCMPPYVRVRYSFATGKLTCEKWHIMESPQKFTLNSSKEAELIGFLSDVNNLQYFFNCVKDYEDIRIGFHWACNTVRLTWGDKDKEVNMGDPNNKLGKLMSTL